MKIELTGKLLYPTDSMKYLGVKIDGKLNWESHANTIATKLNQAKNYQKMPKSLCKTFQRKLCKERRDIMIIKADAQSFEE